MSKRIVKSQWGGVWYFMIHASPHPTSNNRMYGGAYVSCWVNYPHEEGALVLAKYYIRCSGWQCRKVHDRKWGRRSDYVGKKSLRYFDEAAKDGSSFVFHTYPKGRPSNLTKRCSGRSKTRAAER